MALDPTPITELDAFTASVFPPLSGTPVQRDDIKTGYQALANRTKYLHKRGSVVSQAYGAGSIANAMQWATNVFSDCATAQAAKTVLLVPGCAVGDVVLVNLCAQGGTNDTTAAFLRLKVTQDKGGTNVVTFPTGMGFTFDRTTEPDEGYVSVAIGGVFVVSVAGDLEIRIQGATTAATTKTVGIEYNLTFQAINMRVPG